jgi:hypothetical protein
MFEIMNYPRIDWPATATAAVIAAVVALIGADVHAQTTHSYKLVRDETDTGAGFEAYAGATSAVRGASQSTGEASTGAIGGYAMTEFWAWADTASVQMEQTDNWELSMWPLYGMRWGVRGGAWASGHLVTCFSCSPQQREASRPGAWQAAETLELHSGIINLLHSAGYQRSVQFDDAYWRSRRNLATVGFGVEVPFVIRIETPQGGKGDVMVLEAFGREVIDTTRETEYANIEGEFTAYFLDIEVPHEHSSFHGRLMGADVDLYARPREVADRGDIANPSDARIFVADLRGITFDEGRNTFGLYVGARQTSPAHLRNPELEPGETDRFAPLMPDLAVHFASHQARGGAFAHARDGRLARDLKYHASVGTFARVGPSGFGVDRGWKLELDAAIPLDRRWVLRGEAVGVTAHRAYSGRLPDDLPRLPEHGTRFLLGRAELGSAHSITDTLVFDMSIWGERSDRFDPGPSGFATSQPGGLQFRFGASAALITNVF